ncbi:expressed unknown protein [Seminavis robusta]|uniref:Uncharacterized protein n=1 Tax=Seminavis robusta TaxID=568900 RepID=A0A9N8HWH5_9STRA|nr:expressed unknown protein [Seminavis robusta]|eukprot:Sro1649_g288640.1 n/a (452) ;mRNA; r:23428-24783
MDFIEARAEMIYKERGGAMSNFANANCTLFLGMSTIPWSGMSLFAGRDYAKGEVVISAAHFLPLYDSRDGSTYTLSLQQYVFLLKHHHLVANVDGTTFWNETDDNNDNNHTDYSLRATKQIHAGDELFLPFTSHPHSKLPLDTTTTTNPTGVFDDIPTQPEYDLAEEIIRDTLLSFPMKRGRIMVNDKEIEKTLVLVYKVARKLNPKVLRFLPSTKRELDPWISFIRRAEPFGKAALQEKSMNALEMNAQCMSHHNQNANRELLQHDGDSDVSLLATQQFLNGTTVFASPLLLLPLGRKNEARRCASVDHAVVDDDQEECIMPPEGEELVEEEGIVVSQKQANKYCFQQAHLPFLLCPLSPAAMLITSSAGTEPPNVEFQWSRRIKRRNTKALAMSPEQVAQELLYSTKLFMEVVALREIQEGEKLIADMSEDTIATLLAWNNVTAVNGEG